MPKFNLILITGLPGTGKSTLARQIASRYRFALIAKDAIKEAAMDVLGWDAAQSRMLSDVSFAVLFALSRQFLAAGLRVVLEGNFRAGEHEAALRAARSAAGPSVIQILCRVDEAERRARISSRKSDPANHPGHRAAAQMARVAACDAFLELPGERLLFDSTRDCERALQVLIASLDALVAESG